MTIIFNFDTATQNTNQRIFQEVEVDITGKQKVTFNLEYKTNSSTSPTRYLFFGMVLKDSFNSTLLDKNTGWLGPLPNNNNIINDSIEVESGELDFSNVAKIEFYIRGLTTVA